jgi:hypothetical protein
VTRSSLHASATVVRFGSPPPATRGPPGRGH